MLHSPLETCPSNRERETSINHTFYEMHSFLLDETALASRRNRNIVGAGAVWMWGWGPCGRPSGVLKCIDPRGRPCAHKEKEKPMQHPPQDPHFTINIVQGQHGAEFDLHELHLPAGAVTIWINQTDASQVILPLSKEARRVMTLAPRDQEGRVWM